MQIPVDIKNFKLKDFIKQDRELILKYLIVLNLLPPKKTKRKIFNMKLKHVEFIKQGLSSGSDSDLLKIFCKVQKLSKSEVLEIKILDFFGVLNGIKNQIKKISEAEERGLSDGVINKKWEIVQGSERMAKFGIYNVLNQVSRNKPIHYNKVLNMKYSDVFTVLLMDNETAKIQKEMDNLKIT